MPLGFERYVPAARRGSAPVGERRLRRWSSAVPKPYLFNGGERKGTAETWSSGAATKIRAPYSRGTITKLAAPPPAARGVFHSIKLRGTLPYLLSISTSRFSSAVTHPWLK